MNRRRIIIIILLVVILGLLGMGIYWILGGRSDASDETAGNLPEIGGDFDVADDLPAQDTDLEKARLPGTSIAAYHAFDDGVVVTVHRNGTIDRIASTTVTALSAKPVDGFASASFSGDGTRILVLTGNQPRTQVNVFEIETASWRVIPGTFRDATWAPAGSRLAILTPDPATGKTAVALYDAENGKTIRTLAALALGDVSVSWPSQGTVIVADKPNNRSTGSAWSVDVESGRVSLAARGKEGFSAIWNEEANKALAFQANAIGTGGRTKLIEDGIERAVLSFTTIPEKCVFSSLASSASSTTPFVMCGVPRDQRNLQNLVLPDAYYRKAFFTDDVIVGVNLETRTVDFTIAPPASVDAVSLQVVGTSVYYLDRSSGTLYRTEI